jgi:glutathione S-transferase
MAAKKIKLYTFTGSAPSLAARLMLEHKGLAYKPVHLMVGPHAFGMLGRGFQTMTVPALKLDGRRVQGSRDISRALDELAPDPPLFGAGAQQRREIEDAERWGEALADATRRLVLCASQRDGRAFSSVYRHASALRRPAQRTSRALVIRLATAGHRATDRAGEEDLAALPARLDRIDAWIAEGLLGGPRLNAADFQIAPNVALLLCFEQFAPLLEGRPAAALARRVAGDFGGSIGALLPARWLASAGMPAGDAPRPGPMEPEDVLRAIGYDDAQIAAQLRRA